MKKLLVLFVTCSIGLVFGIDHNPTIDSARVVTDSICVDTSFYKSQSFDILIIELIKLKERRNQLANQE